jgi:hypothetical protein
VLAGEYVERVGALLLSTTVMLLLFVYVYRDHTRIDTGNKRRKLEMDLRETNKKIISASTRRSIDRTYLRSDPRLIYKFDLIVFSLNATRPGNCFPSSNSRLAPPPVET